MKEEKCTACQEFKPIMENHLITSHVKDYCKVYIGKIGDKKALMIETNVGGSPTIQVSDATRCPMCGRKLNDSENK